MGFEGVFWFFMVVSLADGSGKVYAYDTKEACLISRATWAARPEAPVTLVTPCAKHPDE